MTKSELVERLSRKVTYITSKDVEAVVKTVLDKMSASLADHHRIEIRGFGSFSLRYRKPRVGRNPKTGTKLTLEGKHVPHFKPGKEMRDRVNSRYLESLHQK